MFVAPDIIFAPGVVPVPHWSVQPVPATPPDAVNVVDEPLQIVVVPDILVGSVAGVCTVTVVLTAPVVLVHEVFPIRLTQYVVEAERPGVV